MIGYAAEWLQTDSGLDASAGKGGKLGGYEPALAKLGGQIHYLGGLFGTLVYAVVRLVISECRCRLVYLARYMVHPCFSQYPIEPCHKGVLLQIGLTIELGVRKILGEKF